MSTNQIVSKVWSFIHFQPNHFWGKLGHTIINRGITFNNGTQVFLSNNREHIA